MLYKLTKLMLLVLLTSMTTGCQWLQSFARKDPPIPVAFESAPTLEQLTGLVNQNTQNARQIQSSVKVSMTNVPAKLTGNLAIEQPNNLRIEAGVLGVSAFGVDIGSNDSVFWVWSKASVGGMEPVMLYSRHDDFARSNAGKKLPIQPQWITQSLGLVTFDSNDQHQGPIPRNDGRVEIRSQLNSPRGMVTRVVVMDPKTGVINQIAMYDSSNNLIAYANAFGYIYDQEHQVRLPRLVEIYFNDPNTNTPNKLSITLGDVSINSFYGDPERIWAMPQPADVRKIDVSKVDLSQRAPAPNGVGRNNSGSRIGAPPRGYQYR